MIKLIQPRDTDDWEDVLGGFVWHVESRREFEDFNPELNERFDSKAWAMVCARQRIGEGYKSVTVARLHAVSINAEEYPDDT